MVGAFATKIKLKAFHFLQIQKKTYFHVLKFLITTTIYFLMRIELSQKKTN